MNVLNGLSMGKGIIRTILDDHRDAALYRHAFTSIYLKLTGKASGKTASYGDESHLIRPVVREIHQLIARNEELEAMVEKMKRELQKCRQNSINNQH